MLQVGNGVSKVFAQAVYEPPGQEDVLQQTFTYIGRPGGRRPPVRFDQLDANEDGKVPHGFQIALNLCLLYSRECSLSNLVTELLLMQVSKDEWTARLGTSKGFDEYDLNGDGVVTAEEYRRGRMKMVTQKRNTVHRR